MNQFWCKQVQGAVVMGFQALAPRFFTGAVEKRVPLEVVTQLTRPSHPAEFACPKGVNGKLDVTPCSRKKTIFAHSPSKNARDTPVGAGKPT
jgi:hypothetical protein